MIALWNRKELYYGLYVDRFSNIRSILAQNGIKYDSRTVNRTSSRAPGSVRGLAGSFGENPKYSYEYYIYVHKNDFSKAV